MTTLPHNPFRFCVINYRFSSAEEITARAQKIEDLGYSTFMLSDHFFNFAPLAGMTAAAQATTALKVGTYVLGNDFYHPAVLAREALAIDLISGGRLEFGLGSGWYQGDYAQTGIPLDSPGVRISRLEESVKILKCLLSGQTASFQGKYYHIDQLSILPAPMQKPHPPLLIGGGSKRVLSLAAREADIVSFNIRTTPDGWLDFTSTTLEATQQKVEWVCQAACDRLPDLEFNLFTQAAKITPDPEHVAQEVAEGWKEAGMDLSTDQILAAPPFLIGDVEQIVEKIQLNRERFGLSYYGIADDSYESFAPVVQRLAGK